jgi:hypothetical protein
MQRFVKALSGSVLLTIMTLSMPGMALAAQNHVMAPPVQDNPINGNVSNAGVWHQENRNGPRHKTDNLDGIVTLTLKDNVNGGLCLRLRDVSHDKVFGNTQCWAAGEYGRKTLATGVRAGTIFVVDAKKWHNSDNKNNHWAGRIFY